MSDLEIQMEALKAGFAALFPDRVVTRDLMDFTQRDPAELTKGVYTLLHSFEGDYTDLIGRSAEHGKRIIKLIGQIQLKDADKPSLVENAEGLMIEEVKNLTRNYPASILHLRLIDVRNSEQMDAPYGWISCRLEMMAAD